MIAVLRDFNNAPAGPNEPVTVTVNIINTGPHSVRGFYYTEHIPSHYTVNVMSLKINGIAGSVMTEHGLESDVYPGSIPHRWIFELPPSFTENNPLNTNDNVEIVYTIVSNTGIARPHEYSWAGMIDSEPMFGYYGPPPSKPTNVRIEER